MTNTLLKNIFVSQISINNKEVCEGCGCACPCECDNCEKCLPCGKIK